MSKISAKTKEKAKIALDKVKTFGELLYTKLAPALEAMIFKCIAKSNQPEEVKQMLEQTIHEMDSAIISDINDDLAKKTQSGNGPLNPVIQNILADQLSNTITGALDDAIFKAHSSKDTNRDILDEVPLTAPSTPVFRPLSLPKGDTPVIESTASIFDDLPDLIDDDSVIGSPESDSITVSSHDITSINSDTSVETTGSSQESSVEIAG